LADDVTVTFAASIEKLIAGMNQATGALKGFAELFEAITGIAGKVAETIAAAFAVDKINEFFEHMAELGTQTQRTASLLGVQTSAVAGLDIAAKASGGSLGEMTTSLERFGANLARGAAGSQQQEAALRALGLSAKDFVGVPLPDVLGKLADHFAVLKDGIDKDAIAMALLGRGGAQMIPIFNQGSEAFKEFAAEAERTGTALSEETVAGFERTHLGLIELGSAMQGVGIQVASIFKPAFDGLVKVLADLAERFVAAMKEGGAVYVLFDTLAIAAKAVASAIAGIIAALEALWTGATTILTALGQGFYGLGKIIYDAFTGNFEAVETDFAAMQASMSKTIVDFSKQIVKTGTDTVAELKTIWSAGADEHARIAQTETAHLAIANRDQVNAAMKAIDEQVKLVEEGLKKQTMLLDGEVKQHAIAQNQKFAALEQYTQQAYEAELKLLQQEAALGNLSVAQKQAVLNKIAQLQAKHETDMIKLDQQSIAAQQQLYQNFFTSIEGAFNSQLRGLLAGTTSWSTAFKNILSDLLIKFVEYCEKTVIEWGAAELAKTTATTTGAAARASAEAAGQGAGLFTTIANAIKSIFASSGQTTAEVTAQVAPVAGPAAPAIGAAAGAATLASAMALLPSLDVGTDFVTRSGLAMIHAGETIQPAQTSGPYTGGGASVQPIFQISAIDGNSVQAFFRSNASQIARILQAHINGNPSYQGA
jgi:hypothetical protein